MGEYRDRNGNVCTLEQMVRREPELAADRIRTMEAELERLRIALENQRAWVRQVVERGTYGGASSALNALEALLTEIHADEALAAVPGSPARTRLVAAIRTITVDATDEHGDPVPNGPTEEALGKLLDTLSPGQVELAADWLNLSAADARELRLAAEAFLGGDFLADLPPGDGGGS